MAPANGAVINTLTPTLIVQPGTDPDAGDIVQFWHRLTTTPDAESGAHLVDSGWRYPGSIPNPNTHFKVPEGVLADGVTYYWHVWSYDGTLLRAPDWVWSFRVELGVGQRASQPHDQLGPAGVNLASGNLMVGSSSPSFPTVGGDVGLSYAYNSAQPMANAGLTGAYYDKPLATADPATHTIGAGDTPAMVRTDPVVSHWWSGSPPGAGLNGTNFTVRWTGYVSVPNAGSYTFGAQSDDGMRITLGGTFVNGVISGGTTVIDRWSEQTNPGGWPNPWGTAYNFPVANSPVPIQIDYYQRTGNSYITLLAQGPLIAGYVFVPSSWLSIEPPALPAGWSVSASLDGGLAYSSARVWDAGVTLVDPMGETHLYAATPGGGYSPPSDEDGVLTRDVSGRLTLHAEDGFTYVFNANGTLASASSATDDRNPAAPIYTWSSIPGSPMISRLATIADPVGGRQITLRYGGDPACPSPTPSGFGAVPRGMLCVVNYWDGTQTKLWYNANGQLARFEDPGRAVAGAVDSPPITDFVYGTNGKLAQVRAPLVADAVAAGVVGYDDAAGTARTVVTYDTSGRVASVTLPAPSSGAARPSHSYEYVSATETRVHVAGLDESITGFARKVALDTAGRWLTNTDATNKTSSVTWDAADRLTSSTDTAGRKTTAIYDVQGRPTDSFGPAPSSCFGADRRPNGTCPAMPHTATVYDGPVLGYVSAGAK